MRWFDGQLNDVKRTLIPYTLHGVNEDIFDEVIKKEDGFYYLIQRCGTMPFTNTHGFTSFKTDGKIIIYPLPSSQVKEIKLGWEPPFVFGDNSTILVNSGVLTPEFTGSLKIDTRYREFRKTVSGNTIDISSIKNIDNKRESYIREIIGTEEGLGDLIVDNEDNPILDQEGNRQYKIDVFSGDNVIATLISPKMLLENEKLSWNAAREKYEVIQFKEERKPIQNGLIAWLDARDGAEGNYIWKDRTDNGNDIDLTSLKKYIRWRDGSYIIYPGIESIVSSKIQAICPEGCTIEVNFESNFSNGQMKVFDGTYHLETIVVDNLDRQKLISVTNGSMNEVGGLLQENQFHSVYIANHENISLFIDNKEIWKSEDEATQYNENINLFIGSETCKNKEYVKLNSIRIYNRCLLDEERTFNYNYEKVIQRDIAQLPRQESLPFMDNMVAWLDARDNHGSKELIWKDRSGNGNDFELINFDIQDDKYGWKDNRLYLNKTSKHFIRSKNVAKFKSIVIFMDNDLNDGSYIMDARDGGPSDSYAGFENDVYLHTAYSKAIYEDETETKGSASLHLKRNKEMYYIESKTLMTCNKLRLFSRHSEDSGYLSCKVKSIMLYDRELTLDELNITKKHFYSVNSWKIDSLNQFRILTLDNRVNEKAVIDLSTLDKSNIYISEGSITLDVAFKEVRFLDRPDNVVATISSVVDKDSDITALDWNEVIGAQGYKVLLDNNVIATVESNHWDTREELKGLLSIIAFNDVTESEPSDEVYVLSVPNETFISYFKNEYNKAYNFEVHFPDTSELEDGYKVYYKVDDRAEQCDIVQKCATLGTVLIHKFSVPIILDRIQIRVVSVNESGENTVVPPTTLYITEAPIWTYQNDSESVLMSWTNNYKSVSRYAIKSWINGIEQDEISIESEGIEVGQKIMYTYPLSNSDNLEISISAVMGDIYHIYSEKISMSAKLDKTNIAPSDFRYRKITDSQIEFSWYDDYTCEDGFEFTYSISNGEVKTIFIPSTTKPNTNRRYTYIYDFEDYGFINAKVRMKWELGTSDYTEEVLIYYLPVDVRPPSYIRREMIDGQVYLEWEGQQYVDKYEVIKDVAGQKEIIYVKDNKYEFSVIYKIGEFTNKIESPDNLWKIDKYDLSRYNYNQEPRLWIKNIKPLETVTKPASGNINPPWGTNFIAHATTYVYVSTDVNISMLVQTDDGGGIYINDNLITRTSTNVLTQFVAPLKRGWNKFEIIVQQGGGGFNMSLSKTLTSFSEIEQITSSLGEPIPPKIQTNIITHFLNETSSEESKPNIFYPCYSSFDTDVTVTNPQILTKTVNTSIYRGTSKEFDIDTKSTSVYEIQYPTYDKNISKYLSTEGPLHVTVSGKELETEFDVATSMIQANSLQGKYNVSTMSMRQVLLENLIHSTITTATQTPYLINTEINKVRIVTLGDSITAGHPGHWAETMTGNEQSQYQYWLNRRLKNQYEIINKGYGSDTTDRMLERFNKDVLGYNATYCIIQGGTNDLYWAMAESDGDQNALDRKVQLMKENIMEMVKRCWDNGIKPIIGTLIPRTGAVGIYKKALYDYNEWIIQYCSTNENLEFVDFFNAGKDAFPPTPLEDPANPGALNPIYDGDAIYDEYGNLIKQGRGIHPSPEGYKIMGEAIPLSLFKTQDDGLKLYLDKECTKEEVYNDEDKLNPFYIVNVDNITRGKTKTIVRYVKNIGDAQVLFAAFASGMNGVDVRFVCDDGIKRQYTNATLYPQRAYEVKIEFDIEDNEITPSAQLHLASRKISTK